MLRKEGVDNKVATMFYRAMLQVVLLLGSESWILSTTIERTVEGTHAAFLKKITGKRDR